MTIYPESWDDALRGDEEYATARVFAHKFEPQAGIDYLPLLEDAAARYAMAREDFAAIDDKALSVLTHVASGTGVLSIGSLVALM